MARAIWNGTVLAESATTHEVDGYVYFPRAAVRMDLLHTSERTPSDRQCPHGVQFYDLAHGGKRLERQAWSYEKPGLAMRAVGQWVSFWDEVEVVA
jgi:uncharacterized protein (DUF427 family)